MPVSVAFETYPMPHLIWGWLETSFGIPPEVFRGFQLWHRPGRSAIWLAPDDWEHDGEVDFQSVGIQVTRRPPPRAKPSTYFAQRFGHYATRDVVELGPADVTAFFAGEFIDTILDGAPERYCIVRIGADTIG